MCSDLAFTYRYSIGVQLNMQLKAMLISDLLHKPIDLRNTHTHTQIYIPKKGTTHGHEHQCTVEYAKCITVDSSHLVLRH